MASVEELCDNIALINRAHKILEGKVMDIRKEHRTDTYEVEISGLNFNQLELPSSCQIIDNQESSGHSLLKIRGFMNHKPNDLLSHLVRQANVHSFKEILPTMNDIFIATVNAAEK